MSRCQPGRWKTTTALPAASLVPGWTVFGGAGWASTPIPPTTAPGWGGPFVSSSDVLLAVEVTVTVVGTPTVVVSGAASHRKRRELNAS